MKCFKWVLFCIFELYFVNDTIGQTPLLQHYTIQDGLPSNKVYCAIRDRRGFAWLATDNGLVRFDGSSFKIYTVKDGLPDNDVFTVFEDNKGKVWVLTSKQTPCFFLDDKLYTAANDTFLAKYFNDPDRYRFTVNPYLKRLMFFVIWEEHYTAVEYGQPPHKIKYIKVPRNRIKGGVFSLYSQDGTDYLIDALTIYNINSCKVTQQYITGEFIQTEINGRDAGLCCGNGIKRAFHFKISSDSIVRLNSLPISCYPINTSATPIIQDLRNELYLIKNDKLIKMTHLRIPNIRYTRIFQDLENNWWFCTKNNGVYLWTYGAATILSPEDEISTLNISKDQKMIIAGLENKRILLLKNLKKPSYHSLPAKNHILTRITSLLPEKGRVYIGGDFQLGFFDIKKSRFKELKSKEFRSLLTFIKDLEFDSEGKILIGATSGAGIYDLIKKKITDSIWNIRTTAVYQVKGKGIYLGTINGLYFRKEGEVNVNRYVSNQLLNNARITDIRADNKNRLWIGTAQYGVFIVVENKILHLDDDISKEAYLSSYYVKQIYFDNKNRTWICTENGLNKIELSNQNKFKVEHINVVSGLANNNVNACTVLNDTLYLATLQGVSRLIYEPSVAKETPKLEITQTYVNNKIAELTNGTRLKFNKNSISIEFTAIAFQSPQDIEYHYRLFGASETWTITKNKRVDLLSLKPGDYKFEIYARNTTTQKKSNIESLTFTVLQPWYSTWWFCLLCFTLIVSLVYLLIKRRINTVKKRSAELNKINKTFAELEMQALRAQMNPHFIFNAMTAIQHYFVSNDEIKANAYMSRFAQLIRRMLDYSSNNFIPLNEEIDLLKNYLDLEAMRFDHKISYTIETDEELNPSEYKLPSLMLQPIIENAVNHGLRMAGMAGEIKLNFELKDNFLLCNITDNGVGIKYAISHKYQQLHHQSKGLEITRKRIESVNYVYNTNVSMNIFDLSDLKTGNNGTSIDIKFPLTLVKTTINL